MQEEQERGVPFSKEEWDKREEEVKKEVQQAFIDRCGGLRIDFADKKVD